LYYYNNMSTIVQPDTVSSSDDIIFIDDDHEIQKTRACAHCKRQLTPCHFTSSRGDEFKSCSICRGNSHGYYHSHKASILSSLQKNAYKCGCGARIATSNRSSHETTSVRHRKYLQTLVSSEERGDTQIMSIADAILQRQLRIQEEKRIRDLSPTPEYVECPCGKRVKRRGLSTHVKNATHLRLLIRVADVTFYNNK
jgi:hypothetical protein